LPAPAQPPRPPAHSRRQPSVVPQPRQRGAVPAPRGRHPRPSCPATAAVPPV